MSNNEVQVINNNGELVVSSRQVAENFCKYHKDVLEIIRNILVAENSATKFFYETTHEYRGQKFPEYLMNRDGFSLLVMGFTGKKALQWKIKYIEAFNAMEKKLTAPQTFNETLDADTLFLIASKWKADSDSRKALLVENRELKSRIAELEKQSMTPLLSPVTLKASKDDKRVYTITQIASEYENMNAVKLNKLLIEWGLQEVAGAHKKLCEGLDETRYVTYTFFKGQRQQMHWKPLGKELIHSYMIEHGYVKTK